MCTSFTNIIISSLAKINIAKNNENINPVLNCYGINRILNIVQKSHNNDSLIMSCYSNYNEQFISYKSRSIAILELLKLDNNVNINAKTK